MDNLTRDVLAAEKAGMSYGQWKAFHPHTNPDRMPELIVRPPKRERSERGVCQYCGATFEVCKAHLRFCSVTCRNRYHSEHNAEYMRYYREKRK